MVVYNVNILGEQTEETAKRYPGLSSFLKTVRIIKIHAGIEAMKWDDAQWESALLKEKINPDTTKVRIIPSLKGVSGFQKMIWSNYGNR